MSTSILRDSRTSFKAVLADPEAYATVLLVILLDKYGTEALTWSPETIQLELHDDFNVILPTVNRDKLLMAINLVVTDDFYQRLPRFIQACNVLSGSEFRPEVFDPADAAECAWGMTEAMLISPPDGDEPFNDDIRYYIGAVLDQEAIRTPPDLLNIGIRNTNTGMVDWSDMSDDPTMFSAEFQQQNDKSQEIQAMLKENLQELMEQLGKLPLENGSTDNIVNKAREHFKN